MQNVVESQLGEHQAGFRSNRGCCDQIFATKILMQRAKEFNKSIYICFVDLHEAYDTVNKNALWKALSKSFSMPEKLIRILKTLHFGTTGLIHADRQISKKFPIEVGVKQGDVLVPMLFNLFLDSVIRVALKQHPDKGVQVEYTYNAPLMHNSRYKLDRSILVQNLSYADDILLTSSNIEDLECLVTSLNNICAKFGLKMNLKKTKFMSISPNNTTRLNITSTPQMSDDTNIERVSLFKYLGSILRSDNSVDAEVESRINRAAQVFRSISRLVWYQNKMKVLAKIKLFKSVIIPTLLYGSETWNLLTHHTLRL